ncbi:MAG: Rpn family recombination-promoting nuclease/putative transposase [Planctomycetota bacterium]
MMILGIDPKVDIAFKRVFGRTEGRNLTISLVNAVLQPQAGRQVAELEILDPYNNQERLDDKLTVLDLKARDETGRLFNVEMQMNLVPSLADRLLYYWSELYSRQLAAGQRFQALRATIAICFLNDIMFPARKQCHSVFGLLECNDRVCLTPHLEMHLLELPKFRRKLELLQEPLDFWLYFFQNAEGLDADALPGPLARPEICEAMEVLKVFTQSDVERDRYENRLKALRDQRSFEYARDEAIRIRDEAVQTRDEAVQTRDEAVQARDKAQQQLADAQRQELVRRIQLAQRLLGHSLTPDDQLLNQPLDQLRVLADELEKQLLA